MYIILLAELPGFAREIFYYFGLEEYCYFDDFDVKKNV